MFYLVDGTSVDVLAGGNPQALACNGVILQLVLTSTEGEKSRGYLVDMIDE